MTRQVVLQRRLETQRLQGSELPSAADVVRLLGCVQSQEYAHALWSLGMRTSGLTAVDVQAEFDRGHFLRTHILRPTWHFVAAEDIRWILEVTAPRVQKAQSNDLPPGGPRSGHAGPRPGTDRRGTQGPAVSNSGRARPGIGRSTLGLGLHRHERRTPGSHLQWPDAR